MKRFNKDYLVKTSYNKEDVEILLKDLSNKVEHLSADEIERVIESDKRQTLPFNESLECLSDRTAKAITVLAELLYKKHGGKFVIISLVRNGIPTGILVKRYIQMKYNVDLPHYAISMIKGKGIDRNAMDFIYDKHSDVGVEHFQFVDGWIDNEETYSLLKEYCKELAEYSNKWAKLSTEIAVLSDTINITDLCGTREELIIPIDGLNSTMSGLISRTIINDLISEDDFHGAVCFEDKVSEDKSYEFIDTVVEYLHRSL